MAMRILKPLVRWGGYYPSKKYTPLVYPGGYTTMDAAIGPLDPLNTFSGDIVRFTTKRGLPMKSLKVSLSPQQDLHGYDSPWPDGGGKNRYNKDTITDNGYINAVGEFSANSEFFCSDFIAVSPETDYYIYTDVNGRVDSVKFFDGNKGYLSGSAYQKRAVTTPDNCYFVRINGIKSHITAAEVYFNYPSTVTTFSPYSNICPISGWTGCEVYVTGHNAWDEEREIGAYNPTTGEKDPNQNAWRNKNAIPIKPDTGYYFYTNSSASLTARVFWYDAEQNYISLDYTFNRVITSPNNAYYCNFRIEEPLAENSQVSINYPSADTEYHPYNGNSYSVTFGETVYGAKPDVVSGEMPITMVEVDMGSLNWFVDSRGRFQSSTPVVQGIKPAPSASTAANILCSNYKTLSANGTYLQNVGISLDSSGTCHVYDPSYPDAASFKAAMSGVQLVYELATPIPTQITPTPITALKGYNAIWSDAGPVEVTAYGTPIVEPNVPTRQALNLLLGGAYRNDQTEDDVSDEEALDILLGGADR